MRGPVVWILASCLLLIGCASSAQWTPGPVETIPPTPAVATATATTTGTSAPLTVPDASGAINADRFASAHFASPSGRIWCALYDDWALCHFPRGMDMSQVETSEQVCPGEDLDVTGVSILQKAQYFCSGDPQAQPQTNGSSVAWWKGAGLPSVKYDGQKLAVLPYGKKLARKGYVCASEKSGLTCGNTDTGQGFRISLAGVTFIT